MLNHEASSRSIWYLVVATFVSTLGGFLFGYDNIVISGAIGYLSTNFHLGTVEIGWAAACALVGCFVGSATAGILADRIGLRKSLLICAFCFAISSVGAFFSGSLTQFVIWRIIGGIGIGAASILSPMYIAEIAPTHVRGRLVLLYQMGVVLGILAAVIVNMFIQRGGSEIWNMAWGWRWMFLAGLVPAVIFGIAIIPALESPRWLMKAGYIEKAIAVLIKINGEKVGKSEANSIQVALIEEDGRFSELFSSGFLKALILGVLLAALSQASGVTPIFSFLPEIFKSAGSQTTDAFFQSVLVSVINLIATIIALWLVDKAGRRILLMVGTGVQFISLAFIGLAYFIGGFPVGVLAGVMVFVGAHAIGNGANVWVVISEIFPNKVRGRAMSIATSSLWVFAFLGNQVFPILMKNLHEYGTFWVFGFMALVNFVFIAKWIPETKGYSLEEIEKIFVKKA